MTDTNAWRHCGQGDESTSTPFVIRTPENRRGSDKVAKKTKKKSDKEAVTEAPEEKSEDSTPVGMAAEEGGAVDTWWT